MKVRICSCGTVNPILITGQNKNCVCCGDDISSIPIIEQSDNIETVSSKVEKPKVEEMPKEEKKKKKKINKKIKKKSNKS